MILLAGRVRVRRSGVLAAVVVLAAAASGATAQDASDAGSGDATGAAGEQFAFWAGADANAGSWSVYAGSGHAFYGTLDEPGWRLRAGGGYGQYSYSRAVLKPADGGGTRRDRQRYTGHKTFSDVLIGYQFQWGTTTVTALAGGNSEHHTIAPYDPEARVESEAYGLKVAGEIWHQQSETHWFASHASFSTAFATYKVEGRSGWRVMPDIDLGLEARVEGNEDYDGGRVGAFANLHISGAALTVAGGIAADRDLNATPYATIGFFMRY